MRRLQSAKSHYRSTASQRNYQHYKSNLAHSRMDPFYDLPRPSLRCRPRSAKN